MAYAKKLGNDNVIATNPNNTPLNISVKTTKNFFVLNISKNGLHSGFNVHGSMISDVQKAMVPSEMPLLENMMTVATDNTT